MNKYICVECGAMNSYGFRDNVRKYEGEGYCFELPVKEAYCKKCGATIWVDELEKQISEKANMIIREQRNIISKEDIVSIVDKYNASQKFISRLLGWGEITLTRYISGGYTPNANNSKKLRDLENPYIVQDLLYKKLIETDGEIKNEKSYYKMQGRVIEEFELLENKYGKLYQVVDWFLAQSSYENPMTHLALQKLLYFSQSWYKALNGEWLFKEDCQAWLHGAVYIDVYQMFKKFRYSPLPQIDKESNLSDQEKKILNVVKEIYFDVYSAKGLEYICHREKPYINAFKNGDCIGKDIIKKEEIASYYEDIVNEYGISIDHTEKIKLYLKDIV